MSSRRITCFVLLILFIAFLAVFRPVVRHDFVSWDDDINLYDNPYLNPASGEKTLRFWKIPYYKLYIPLTYTLWSGLAGGAQYANPDAIAVKNYPHVFHAASLIVHLLNVFLVFSILVTLLRRAAPSPDEQGAHPHWHLWAASFGALLFALHPIQVEPVAWATGLKDLLGGLMSLLALRFYISYAVVPAGKRRHLCYALATVFFLLGLLSKPSTAAIPFIAASLDFWILRRPIRRVAGASGLWLALVVPWYLMLRSIQPETGIGFITPLWQRPFIAGDTLAFYLYKLILPLHLAPDYGRTPESVLMSQWAYLAWIIPLVLALLLLWRGKHGVWRASAAVFVAGILPVLGLIPFQHQNISTVADRYFYLSMLGPSLALSYFFLRNARTGRRLIMVAGSVLLLLFGLRSVYQVRYWQDTYALFGHTLRVNPNSTVSHNNLGHAHFLEGRYDQAVTHYQEAIRLKPHYGTAHNNLGNVHLMAGRIPEAMVEYRKALDSRNPEDVIDAYNNLGIASDRLGKTEEAIAYYRKVIRLDPDYFKAYNNLALVLVRKGDVDEALRLYRRAFALKPNYGDVQRNLSGLLNDLGYETVKHGGLNEAISYYEEAIRVRPDFLKAWVNLGDAHLASGDVDAAIQVWTKALRVMPHSFELHHNLAVAWLRKDNKEQARAHLEEALRLKPDFPASLQLLEELE